MDEAARLAAWENFYIIVGSSAGALTGLQFVVIALIAESRTRPKPPEIAAFGTPTILHFCTALLVSCLLSAPWPSFLPLGLTLAACGVAGVVYAVVVVTRARQQQAYRPVLEDWVWHAVLPFLAYAVLLAGAVLLPRHSGPALSLVAAVTLGLVFIGIHNSWDTITYIAVDPGRAQEVRSGSQRGGTMTKSHTVIESPRVPRRGPYSQAVRVGELIFVAGQAGLDPVTGVVAGTTFEVQARQAFENLRAVLEDAGSGLERVVKTTCFLAVPETFDQLNALYAEYFPAAPPPRSTPVVQLPRGLLFSIEAIATAGPAGGAA